MDEFTKQHLAAWIDNCVHTEDRDDFLMFATDAITDDPGLAEYGWSSLYRTFRSTYVARFELLNL